jgi:predicted metalloprotease
LPELAGPVAYPQYPGTGPNTPCGPAFQRQPTEPPRIDTYWSQQFRNRSAAYRPPMLIQVPGQLQYDPNTVTIEYDPAVLNGIIADTGIFSVVIALAHEQGHNVQFVRGRYPSFMPAIGRELDADRLAGSYLRWAQQQGFLRRCDFAAAAMAVFQAGDTLPAFDPQAQGTPAARLHALLQGYMNGPNPF